MKKPTKEMIYLLIGALFGGIIGLGIELLYSDLDNVMSWIMFFIGIIVFGVITRWILSIFYKKVIPEYDD